MNSDGVIRRTDLHLRGEYPHLDTSIYKIEDKKYRIYCRKFAGDFEAFQNKFSNFKPIFSDVELTIDQPSEYQEIIPGILDTEISKGFEGVLMSKIDLFNLLIAKFPKVSFHKISDEHETVNIHFAKYWIEEQGKKSLIFLNKIDEQRILKFLNGLKTALKFNLIEEEFDIKPNTEAPKSVFNPIQYIYSSRYGGKIIPEYSRRDEELWFGQIDSIFEGNFNKDDLFFYDSKEYSCYVDYSTFPNIDLRNHLFLFQVIFLTPPFSRKIGDWLLESKIQELEFLELIAKGRIRIILTQPDKRYDTEFLEEIYKIEPTAIISRRALSCLQQIDIVELSDNYLFNDQKVYDEIKSFCEIVSKIHKPIDPRFIYDLITWPVRARRSSFEQLHRSGSFSTPNFGVNNVLQSITSKMAKKDLEFEFVTNSTAIHIASALNGIYFPFKTLDGYSDLGYASIMGNLLNFYKNATANNIAAFIENQELIKSGVSQIAPIEIIEFNDFISIDDFEKVLSKDLVYPNSKQLIESLADLSIADRKVKISYYNEEIKRNLKKKDRKSSGLIDLGVNATLDGIGVITGLFGLSTGFSLLKIGAKKLPNSFYNLKHIIDRVDDASNRDIDRANIHFLTKINRVAKLKI